MDGVQVIQEVPSHTATAGGTSQSKAKSSPPLGITMTDYSPPAGHADVISDITMVQGSQSYVVSASKDGVVKVWK